MALLRFLFADISQKVIALLIASFLWFTAMLDRSYVTNIQVPVSLGEVTTAKIITGFETRTATVTIEGKGRDLVGLQLKTPEFRVNVPELRAGVHEFKLDPADLNLPKGMALRAVAPEYIDLRLNIPGRRVVDVIVPVRGEPVKGLSISALSPAAEVTLVGPQEDIPLFSSVVTESLELSFIRRDTTVMLYVVPPRAEGFSADPESVPVAVAVEAEGARIFLGVPVRLLVSESVAADVKPKEAQIAVAGPSSRLDGLMQKDISARIRVAGLEPGRHLLSAEIVLPPGFYMVRCEPSLFEVTVK